MICVRTLRYRNDIYNLTTFYLIVFSTLTTFSSVMTLYTLIMYNTNYDYYIFYLYDIFLR